MSHASCSGRCHRPISGCLHPCCSGRKVGSSIVDLRFREAAMKSQKPFMYAGDCVCYTRDVRANMFCFKRGTRYVDMFLNCLCLKYCFIPKAVLYPFPLARADPPILSEHPMCFLSYRQQRSEFPSYYPPSRLATSLC